jgi:diguanylate cyclase (GGDEF)-like protein
MSVIGEGGGFALSAPVVPAPAPAVSVPTEALIASLAIFATDDVFVVSDAERRVQWVSSSVATVLGWSVAEFRLVCTHLLHPDDQGPAEATSALVRAMPGVHAAGVGRHLATDGSWRWLDVTAWNLLDEHGVVVTRFRDVTELHTLRVQVAAAERDSLTDLGTRAAARAELSARLAAGDRRVAVLFCDLDGFKAVNDRYGHLAGDEVLRAVVRRAESVLRDGDLLCRWGGDELIAVLDVVDDADVTAAAERIEAAVGRQIRLRGRGVVVEGLGVSIGIALADLGEAPDDVIDRADRAMYAAKRLRQ